MYRENVFAAIDRERTWQEHKWGTNSEHPHSVAEWLLIIESELNEAKQAWVKGSDDVVALSELIQVAAVAVAALEQHGAPERPWAAFGMRALTTIRWERHLENGNGGS